MLASAWVSGSSVAESGKYSKCPGFRFTSSGLPRVHHLVETQAAFGGNRMIRHPFRHLVLEYRGTHSIQHLGIVRVKFNHLLRFLIGGSDRSEERRVGKE